MTTRKVKDTLDEDLKRKSEMFKDLTRNKRGPKKSDEPKKKRTVFNRITPTIKQMIDNSMQINAVTDNSVNLIHEVPRITQMTDLSNNLISCIDNNNQNNIIISKSVGDSHAELFDLLGLTEANNTIGVDTIEKENLIKGLLTKSVSKKIKIKEIL